MDSIEIDLMVIVCPTCGDNQEDCKHYRMHRNGICGYPCGFCGYDKRWNTPLGASNIWNI
jgi:hypothetical protein